MPDCCCLVFAGPAVLAEVIHHYQSCVCARLLLFGVVRSDSPDGVDPPSYKDLCLQVRLAVHVLVGPTVLTEVIHHYQARVCTRMQLFGVCRSDSLDGGDPPLSGLCLYARQLLLFWY